MPVEVGTASRAAGASAPGRERAPRLSAGGAVLARALVLVLAALSAGCSEVDVDGGAIDVTVAFGEVGLFPGQFSYPRGIDVVGDGSVVVVDKSARVQRLDATTGAYVGGFQTPEWSLGKPTGLTVGPHPIDPRRRAVWVADTHYHRVLVYDLPEDAAADPRPTEPLLSFGRYGDDLGGFVYPTDIALVPGADGRIERVYVSEYGGNDRVTCFEPRAGPGGTLEFEARFSFGAFGVAGDGEADDRVEFNRAQSVAYDAARGELVVVDACNHRLGRFTLDGELVRWIDGGPDARFEYPYGLALLGDGSALVVEFGACRVRRVDLATGAVLGGYGRPGRGLGELASPWGVAAAGRTAWVLDSYNNRVIGFAIPVEAVARAGSGGRRLVGGGP